MKGTKKMEQAKRLADWMASKEANQVTSNWWAVVAYPGVAKKLEGIPENYEKLLSKNDLELVGQEPGPHPEGVEQALRRQVGSQVQLIAARPVLQPATRARRWT